MNKSDNKITIEDKSINIFILTCISIVLFFKFHLLLASAINQDEFVNLSLIWEFKKGTIVNPFQTFMVHFFTWITYLSNDEIIQIIIARVLLYILYISSCLIIYQISKKYLNKTASLFSLLCYVSFSYVLANASSLRADSISCFLCLLSIRLLMHNNANKQMLNTIMSAIAMALALIVTVKSIFYLPLALVAIAANEPIRNNISEKFKSLCHYTFTLVSSYLIFFVYHTTRLATEKLAAPTQWIKSTSSKAITLNDFSIRYLFFKHSFYQNTTYWFLLIIGIFFTIYSLRGKEYWHEKDKLLLMSFSMPLLSLTFYYNTYPYYYAFILPTSAVFCGLTIHVITEHNRKSSLSFYKFPIYVLCILMLLSSYFYYRALLSTPNAPQKQFLKAVHQIFPEPVTYIDGFSMVPSFTKEGFLMTSWGMEFYLKSGNPIMKNMIVNKKPIFLLANVPQLDQSLPRDKAVSPLGYGLLEEDWEILQSNFIHYWGIIYIIGKQIIFPTGHLSQDFEILIPGFYLVESENAFNIDGFDSLPRQFVYLDKGTHRIIIPKHLDIVKLRFGNFPNIPNEIQSLRLFPGDFY